MSLPLAFRPEVREDVEEAYAWYEQQRSGLGEDFLAALDQVYARLQQTPEMHAAIYRDVRRGLLHRFPYGVFYRVEANQVLILAVRHNRRNPADWQARA